MDKANSKAQAALNALQTSSTRSPEETSRKTAFPKSWVSALFKKFQARYGHKWSSVIDGIEEIAVNEWADGMAGLTADHVKFGLDSWHEDWPPSMDEFVKTCTGQKDGKNEFGMDYVPEYYRTQPAITDKSRMLSSDERESRRADAAKHIQSLREGLKNVGNP